MRYAVLGGGKRLRPLLVWHACAAACDRPKVCLPAAAAIEYIHAFSLVHDDLPAMDDDDLRRGQPTLHIHTSEAMAILAGDALLNLAFAALTRVNIDPAHCLRLVEELTAGCAGMISGQIFDSPATDEDHRMLLQVVTHSRNISRPRRVPNRRDLWRGLGGHALGPDHLRQRHRVDVPGCR